MIEQKSISPRAWAALFSLATIWGLSFVAIRVALNEIGPLTVVAHRTFWAMLVLWAVVALSRQPLPRDISTWSAFFVMGLLNNVLPFSLMAWGQLHIESGLTSILNASTAVFGVLVAAMVFADEKLTGRKVLGVGLGFAGVVTAIGLESLLHFDLQSLAQLAVIAGAFLYAVAAAWARKRLGHLRPQVAAAGMLTASTAIALPLALALEGPIRHTLAAPTVLAIGYYAVIATAGAYLLYYYILRHAGSGNLLVVTLLIPPVAIVAGALLLDESLAPNAYLGFAILACGLLILDGRIIRRLGHPRR